MEVENGLAIVKDEKGNIDIVKNYQNLEKIEELKYKIEFLEKYQERIRTSRRVSINCEVGIAVAGLMPLLASSTLFMSWESPLKYVELLLPMAISSYIIGFSVYDFYLNKYGYKFCTQYKNEQLDQINEQLKPLLADSKRLIETKGYVEINKEKIFKEIRNNFICLKHVGDNYKYYKNAFLEGTLEKRLEKLNDNDYIESLKKQFYISPLGRTKIITDDNHIINAHIETLKEVNFTDEAIDIANKYIGQECYKRKYSM